MTSHHSEFKLKIGGTLNPRKDLYIERKEKEDEVYCLLEQGEYCNILASRQVGKSSLMKKISLKLRNKGIRLVDIDIAGELGSPEEPNIWYIGFLGKVARSLHIDIKIKDWWHKKGEGTPNQRLLQFFREEVFTESNSPVVVFVD